METLGTSHSLSPSPCPVPSHAGPGRGNGGVAAFTPRAGEGESCLPQGLRGRGRCPRGGGTSRRRRSKPSPWASPSARDRGPPGSTRCCRAHPLPAAPSQGALREASPEGGTVKEPEQVPLFILTLPIDSIFIVMQELVYAFLIFIIITWQGAVVQLCEEREERKRGKRERLGGDLCSGVSLADKIFLIWTGLQRAVEMQEAFFSFLNKNEDQSRTQIKVLRRSRPSPAAAGSFQGWLAAEDPVLFASC